MLQRPTDEHLRRPLAQTARDAGHQRRAQQRRDLIAVQHVGRRRP